MCGQTVLQAAVQALEQPPVSRSGQDLSMLRAMSLDGVPLQASPSGTPGGEYCTRTVIFVNHKPQVVTLKVGLRIVCRPIDIAGRQAWHCLSMHLKTHW